MKSLIAKSAARMPSTNVMYSTLKLMISEQPTRQQEQARYRKKGEEREPETGLGLRRAAEPLVGVSPSKARRKEQDTSVHSSHSDFDEQRVDAVKDIPIVNVMYSTPPKAVPQTTISAQPTRKQEQTRPREKGLRRTAESLVGGSPSKARRKEHDTSVHSSHSDSDEQSVTGSKYKDKYPNDEERKDNNLNMSDYWILLRNGLETTKEIPREVLNYPGKQNQSISEENLEKQVPAWYCIKHVVIKLNSPLLQIVNIVDLPGSGDAEPIREKIAKRFIDTQIVRCLC